MSGETLRAEAEAHTQRWDPGAPERSLGLGQSRLVRTSRLDPSEHRHQSSEKNTTVKHFESICQALARNEARALCWSGHACCFCCQSTTLNRFGRCHNVTYRDDHARRVRALLDGPRLGAHVAAERDSDDDENRPQNHQHHTNGSLLSALRIFISWSSCASSMSNKHQSVPVSSPVPSDSVCRLVLTEQVRFDSDQNKKAIA